MWNREFVFISVMGLKPGFCIGQNSSGTIADGCLHLSIQGSSKLKPPKSCRQLYQHFLIQPSNSRYTLTFSPVNAKLFTSRRQDVRGWNVVGRAGCQEAMINTPFLTG